MRIKVKITVHVTNPKTWIIFRVFSEWLIPEPGESYMPQIPSAPLPAPNSANKSDQVTDHAMDVGFKKRNIHIAGRALPYDSLNSLNTRLQMRVDSL